MSRENPRNVSTGETGTFCNTQISAEHLTVGLAAI